MFVAFGFDDNAYSGLEGSGGDGGLSWALDLFRGRNNPAGGGLAATYDGAPLRATFYNTGTYVGAWVSESPVFVKQAWHQALQEGHEIGNHTYSHLHGGSFSASEWDAELAQCTEWLTKPFDSAEVVHTPDDTKGMGADADALYGFRTPFLEYNDATFEAVRDHDLWYDCSIEEGWQSEHDGTNFNWPYTLDQGSPGHDVLVEWGLKEPITAHPGLWELPVYPVVVPPDDRCAEYGIAPGLRDKLHAMQDWFDVGSGKITGFDYNLWVSFGLSKDEFVATLKHTLDLRLEGNRAPFLMGAHTDEYSSKYTAPPNATAEQRREAIEEFVAYALEKDVVRVVSYKDVLDWLRRPVAL
ncbi:MAG: polysaccharide deacetylase family protein [Nannocystaceae bacterium]